MVRKKMSGRVFHLEIDGNCRVGKVLEVHGEHLLGHVVVVQLVVAEGHVDVEGEVLAVVEQDPLVNVDGLLVMRPERSTF